MAEMNQKLADVLVGQVGSSDIGYSFEEATVTFATGMLAGAALDLIAGKYVWSTIATAANAVAVLADIRTVEGYETLVDATDYTLVVAKRGVTVNKTFFNLSDQASGAAVDTAAAAFEVAGANKVTDKIAV